MGFWSNGPTFRARRSRRERGRGAACRRPRPLRRGYLAVERAAVEQSRDIVGSRQRLGNHKVALPCHGQEAAQLCQGVAMVVGADVEPGIGIRSEEHTSELQSLMRISYAVFCLKKKKKISYKAAKNT